MLRMGVPYRTMHSHQSPNFQIRAPAFKIILDFAPLRIYTLPRGAYEGNAKKDDEDDDGFRDGETGSLRDQQPLDQSAEDRIGPPRSQYAVGAGTRRASPQSQEALTRRTPAHETRCAGVEKRRQGHEHKTLKHISPYLPAKLKFFGEIRQFPGTRLIADAASIILQPAHKSTPESTDPYGGSWSTYAISRFRPQQSCRP